MGKTKGSGERGQVIPMAQAFNTLAALARTGEMLVRSMRREVGLGDMLDLSISLSSHSLSLRSLSSSSFSLE